MAPRLDAEIKPFNPPDWMSDSNPQFMERAAKIAARLVEEGYSEEQAYEIALERLQEDTLDEELDGEVYPI